MNQAADLLFARALLVAATFGGLVLALGILAPRSWSRDRALPPLRLVRGVAFTVARNPGLAVAAIFAVALLSGAANGVLRLPVPSVNDEFAYLLGADTFAQGRLANPQHPMWHHFETFSVSHDPVYASKYPPAASAFMAIGQVFFGHPWWGQLLVFALAAAAVAWMLRAWVGPRWAQVGGVLVALHPVMQHFSRYDYNWSNYSWSHSYWGGSVTMLGAALLFGGLRRFVRNGRAVDIFLLGLGLVLLAHSRPFEGLIVSIPAAWILLRHLLRSRPGWPAFAGRVVVPLAATLLPALLFGLHYNAATTGNAVRLAHQHYADQYGTAAELLVQSPRTPPASYRNREMGRFYMGWVRPAFEAQRHSFEHYWSFKSTGIERFVWFYFGVMAPALLAALVIVHRRWWRLAFGLVFVSMALVFVTFEFHPHYAAAAAPLIQALIAIGLARLWQNRSRYRLHARLLVLILIVLGTVPRLFDLPTTEEIVQPEDWPRVRQTIVQDLEKLPGKDLVVVTYLPEHSVFREWVKNGANLEEGQVVWARDLGTEESRARLLDHYSDRRVWILKADMVPPALTRLRRDEPKPAAGPATKPSLRTG